MPRMKLYLNFDRVLAGPELETLRGMVRRRGEREPLQHIIGTAAFCGLELAVNRDVLIPRPETELLAEEAGKFLAALPGESAAVLDFGTGSGCLALFLAAKCPAARVEALDVSEAALRVAQENAVRLGLAGRVLFHLGDGFAALPDSRRFALIVSNPPYIPRAEIETLEPEVRDHDPRLALDGGPDGLDFYRRLGAEAGAYLEAGGGLMLELGHGQAGAVAALLTEQGWTVGRVLKDYSGHERILIAQRGH
jgi:release factor glutamine methyltransferase